MKHTARGSYFLQTQPGRVIDLVNNAIFDNFISTLAALRVSLPMPTVLGSFLVNLMRNHPCLAFIRQLLPMVNARPSAFSFSLLGFVVDGSHPRAE